MKLSSMLAKLLMLAFATQLSAAAYAADAGKIERVSGNTTITGPNNQARSGSANGAIQSGDTITTGPGSEVLIKMADNTAIVLRPNTQFQINDFKFEEKRTDTAVSTLIRGAARFVTGLIGKAAPNNVAVRTSTATVGIRGTDFEVAIREEDNAEGRAGLYNTVFDGRTNVQLAQGPTADVNKDKTAFAPANPRPGESLLQILDDRPVFLQSGGGFDALMQSLTSMPVNVIQQMPNFR